MLTFHLLVNFIFCIIIVSFSQCLCVVNLFMFITHFTILILLTLDQVLFPIYYFFSYLLFFTLTECYLFIVVNLFLEKLDHLIIVLSSQFTEQ